jgi:hypothetical protein
MVKTLRFFFFVAALTLQPHGGRLAVAGELDAEVKDLTYVGFDYHADRSRIFVNTTEPVHYSLDTSRPDRIVLTLDNTRVPVFNNTRALPTEHFASPVRRIEVKTIEGPSPSVRIEIFTRRRSAVRPHQQDRTLSLDLPHSA